MIKRLQLRGISRKPSDRYTEDGGCAESLNVFIDNDETAPALKPVVVNSRTDESGHVMFPSSDWGHDWEAVFLHKTPHHERAIIKYTDNSATKLGVWNPSQSKCDPFYTLDSASGETFIRCINLGNSLGLVTSNGTSWVLLHGETYKNLGKSIPFPAFTFANYDVYDDEEVVLSTDDIIRTIADEDKAPGKAGGLSNETLKWIFEEIDAVLASNAKLGIFNRQMFAVLAIRLYDGTRIASVPVLIASGFDSPYSVTDYLWAHDNRRLEYANVSFNMAYKLFFRLDENTDFFEDWEDIIDSFEIYLSPQIDVDRTKSFFLDDYEPHETDDVIDMVTGTPVLGKGKFDLDQYLNSSNFYRVYSSVYSEETMETLGDGLIIDTKDFMSTDNLVTAGLRLDTLSDMKHYETRFDRATLYNNKIVATGITEKVAMEIHNPIATYYYNPTLSDHPHPTYTYRTLHDGVLAFRMTFYLRDSSGKSFSVKATNKGSEYFVFQSETINETTLWSNGYGMIFCPDVRAFAVDVQAVYGTLSNVQAGNGTVIGAATLSMTEHPNLDCAYWYGDIMKELVEFCTQSATYTAGASTYTDNRPNMVYMSEMDNPFVFPVTNRYTLNSKVLGTAIATQALSTGQFGQFPIYVFTEDGIWAMESASDGTIVSTKPMSREVCSNPDSITPIDNAVVFVTEKAVMLVAGSQITDLSPFMNGRHFCLDLTSREAQLIGGGDWAAFTSVMADDTHFMAFMEKAQIAYDYKGSRLVFFNESESYQYVFMLKTSTWHKMFADDYPAPLSFSHTLNAYPDSFVNVNANGSRVIWDLSSKLDVTSSESLKGVIVTRPFDLDAPDVRKAIRDIRIRGRFNRSDARYILLGSMDGINWGVLPSLHGGSYKWFRLIVLTSLSPTERISWIDVDYDTRMQNKFR